MAGSRATGPRTHAAPRRRDPEGLRRGAAMSTQQIVRSAFVIAEPQRLVGTHEVLPDLLPSQSGPAFALNPRPRIGGAVGHVHAPVVGDHQLGVMRGEDASAITTSAEGCAR